MQRALHRPNLFRNAYAELSQDAFLAWLLEWADPVVREADSAMHEAGLSFVSRLMQKANRGDLADAAIENVRVRRQKRGVDILAEIEFVHLARPVALLIEDKVYASAHGNQLKRYREWAHEKYGAEYVVLIFLKTRDQSSYSKPRAEGYTLFLRQDLLSALDAAPDHARGNGILSDFYENLTNVEDEVQSYRHLPLSQWKRSQAWVGFFMELERRLDSDGSLSYGWGWVNNQSGGFWGCWWDFEDHAHDDANTTYRTYLQLENSTLTAKANVGEPRMRSQIRDNVHAAVVSAAQVTGVEFEKPGRFGSGNVMTTACLTDAIRTTDSGLVDIDETVSMLEEVRDTLALARCRL